MAVLYIRQEEFNGSFNLSLTLGCEQCPNAAWFQYGDEYYTHYLVNGKWIKVFVTQRNHGLKGEWLINLFLVMN